MFIVLDYKCWGEGERRLWLVKLYARHRKFDKGLRDKDSAQNEILGGLRFVGLDTIGNAALILAVNLY